MHKNSGCYRDYLAVTPEMINAKESNFTAKNIDQLNFAATHNEKLLPCQKISNGIHQQVLV